MTVHMIHANILEWSMSYSGPLFHAALMDAPYEMKFMGRGWDNSGVAFDPETWKAIARILHPGAFLFVFAGTINDDLISVAMRQAGLRKYHKALAWGYGSGFPKAARLDTVIDRRAGVERTKIGTCRHQPKFAAKEFDYRKKDNGFNSRERETFDLTKPATPLAEAWQGHRYGGQVLKPSVEPILIFQKPYEGDAVGSITRTGAGALWVDGARIETNKVWDGRDIPEAENGVTWGGSLNMRSSPSHPNGRWPANLILSHSPDCAAECAPDCPVRHLGEQSGESTASGDNTGLAPSPLTSGIYGERDRIPFTSHGDTGTAARFFYQADWMAERLENADAVIYEAKASRTEREAGLDPRQIRLLNGEEIESSDAEITGALRDSGRSGRIVHTQFARDTINDGRKKPIDNPYQRGETTRRNTHPTVKPLSLCKHLATLLLPPDLYAPRRLLVPFAGVASEVIGTMLAGWEEVIGIELEEDHVKIAEARIAYWSQMRYKITEASTDIKVNISKYADDGQMEMF